MIQDLLAAKLREYDPSDVLEQENVLQEVMQHFILGSLSRTGLFTKAVFHGGSCLRIFHRTRRFSEDLDFMLKAPDEQFQWASVLATVLEDHALEGIHFEVTDRSSQETAVRKAFLKTDSIGTTLDVDLPFNRHVRKKLRIKLEVDTRPPAGSTFETRYLTFPATAAITTQTLASGFATKLHALLCRSYTKGRDWYDFIWYVGKRVIPSLPLFECAIAQQGPWAGTNQTVTEAWLVAAVRSRISTTDWETAARDVRRFLPAEEQNGLALWGKELFLQQVDQLEACF
ncbi:nucleotidyl transferase AbiEii/AbiGii toxin family protein [Planctomycetota bacterium]